MTDLNATVPDPEWVSEVLVTGASRGIGREVVGELACRGHRVTATARNPADLAGLPAARTLALDVTDPDSVAAAFAAAGDVDAVISNAGNMLVAPVECTPLAVFTDLLQVNVVGALRVAQEALPALRRRGGRLICTSSLLARAVMPLSGAYCATKSALDAAMETLAFEVVPFGVSVALVELPAVATDVLETAPRFIDERYAPLAKEIQESRFPFMSVEEAATAIADAVEADSVPLRLPVGPFTRQMLAAVKAMPDDAPAVPLPIDWR